MIRRRIPGLRSAVVTVFAVLAALAPTTTSIAAPTVDQTVTLVGRGNGHGIGMSQYGAYGLAKAGRTATQIIGHYYKGASIAERSVNFDPRIGIALDEPTVTLVARGGGVDVTAGNVKVVLSKDQAVVVDLRRGEDGVTRCRARFPDGTKKEYAGSPCVEADPRSGARVEVRRPNADGTYRYRAYGRSSVVEVHRDAQSTGGFRLDTVVELDLDDYLYGLAEMPYSWDASALQAQAVAGRSYALWRLLAAGASPDRGCQCHLLDSQSDQVFKGWDQEGSAMWDRWKSAVDGTSGKVVVAPGAIGTRSDVVQAFYSSSSNGRTEAKHELWGGDPYPYLASVDDSWAFAGTGNPYSSWSVGTSRRAIASAAGLDALAHLVVTDRSTSGAVTELTISGFVGNSWRVVRQNGSWARGKFGLRSTTFDPVGASPFTDVGSSSLAEDIYWLTAHGVSNGCSDVGPRFCPTRSVSRAQMAAFLTRAYNLPPGTRTFTDTRGHFFEDEIAALADAGITLGCSETAFCPDVPVRRDQMASFIARAEGLTLGARTSFVDARTNSHSRAIEAIRVAGITNGCDAAGRYYCPADPVKRAQMAAFIRRAST